VRISGASFDEYCAVRKYVVSRVVKGHLAHREIGAPENGEVPYLSITDGSFKENPEAYSFAVGLNKISTTEKDADKKQAEALNGLVSLITEMSLKKDESVASAGGKVL